MIASPPIWSSSRHRHHTPAPAPNTHRESSRVSPDPASAAAWICESLVNWQPKLHYKELRQLRFTITVLSVCWPVPPDHRRPDCAVEQITTAHLPSFLSSSSFVLRRKQSTSVIYNLQIGGITSPNLVTRESDIIILFFSVLTYNQPSLLYLLLNDYM